MSKLPSVLLLSLAALAPITSAWAQPQTESPAAPAAEETQAPVPQQPSAPVAESATTPSLRAGGLQIDLRAVATRAAGYQAFELLAANSMAAPRSALIAISMIGADGSESVCEVFVELQARSNSSRQVGCAGGEYARLRLSIVNLYRFIAPPLSAPPSPASESSPSPQAAPADSAAPQETSETTPAASDPAPAPGTLEAQP